MQAMIRSRNVSQNEGGMPMQSKFARRGVSIAIIAAMSAAAPSAFSQRAGAGSPAGYPVKSIRVVDTFAPGGGSDMVIRLIGPRLTEVWGQQIVVDNRGGAGGTIGAEAVVRANPDGYTLMIATGSYAVNPSVYKLPYHAVNDVTSIGQLTSGPFVVSVHPSVAAKNIKELVALAKAKPGALNFASTGTGGITHLATEYFKLSAGVNMTHVPYKGTGAALPDLLGGQVQLMFAASAGIMPHVKSGKLRALATTGPKRMATAPELPTVNESGVPGYDATLWYSMLGPKGIPKAIVTQWNTELNRILQMPDVRERLVAGGLEPAGGTPEDFAIVLKRDVERWAAVVKQAGVKLD
jgi:tripartite-type tricarboxylate transporter receptor subunit TctC